MLWLLDLGSENSELGALPGFGKPSWWLVGTLVWDQRNQTPVVVCWSQPQVACNLRLCCKNTTTSCKAQATSCAEAQATSHKPQAPRRKLQPEVAYNLWLYYRDASRKQQASSPEAQASSFRPLASRSLINLPS